MEHFRVLPTDPRLKRLSDDQISLLMFYWLNNDERSMKTAYGEHKANEEAKKEPQFKRKDLKDIGYTDAEIEEMTGGR